MTSRGKKDGKKTIIIGGDIISGPLTDYGEITDLEETNRWWREITKDWVDDVIDLGEGTLMRFVPILRPPIPPEEDTSERKITGD